MKPAYLRPMQAAAAGGAALYDRAQARWVSYSELEQRIADVSARFAPEARGLALLACPLRPATVVAYLALVRAGHTVALLDPDTSESHLATLAEAYQPEWVITPEPRDEAAAALDDGLFVSRRNTSAQGPLHPELALLLSTSGSTGSPKFVRLSAAAVEANAVAIAEALGLTPHARAMAYQGLHYAYGLSVLNSHLKAGASLLLSDRTVLERDFWAIMRAEGCDSFAGVPYTYETLRRLGPDTWCIPTLTTMTQAGGRLKPELVAWYHQTLARHGKHFLPMYGQTEATARIAVMPPEALPDKLGSVGRVIPGGTLTIEPLDPAAAEHGAGGEIVYTGPNVMMGYATGRADLARGDECQGRLATGDLGYLDADGFLYVTGRLKRIAKLFGLRLNLDEVEDLVRQLGPAAAVEQKERLVLYCEFGDGDSLRTLTRELAGRLKLHHTALQLRRVEALPLLASGKVDYQRLREDG
ncbi:MAG: AMP-binding protein [Candidatus Sericytochromatia bacterium]|nr:AMP-binding protein [Candidatus Sericytochromatia bacterium]